MAEGITTIPSTFTHFLNLKGQPPDAESSNEVMVEAAYNPRLPSGVIVALLMVTGLMGNCLVLYIYNFKMERNVFSTFATVLAILDMMTVLVSMPIDVVIKTVLLDKTAAFEAICKVVHLEVYSTSIASGSVLLLITNTRYNRICHPLRPDLTKRKARILCALIMFLSALLCTVTLVINGVEMVKVAVGERDYIPTNLTLKQISNGTEMGQIWVQDTSDKLYERNLQSNSPFPEKQTEIVEVNICRTSENHKGTALYYSLQAILFIAFVGIFTALLVLHCRIANSVVAYDRRRSSMQQESIYRFSTHSSVSTEHETTTHMTASMFRIFATITIIFVVSYLPHLICLIVEKSIFTSEVAVPWGVRVVMDVVYNLPYINVVANPVIYMYRSEKFRRHCLDLLCRCCPDHCVTSNRGHSAVGHGDLTLA